MTDIASHEIVSCSETELQVCTVIFQTHPDQDSMSDDDPSPSRRPSSSSSSSLSSSSCRKVRFHPEVRVYKGQVMEEQMPRSKLWYTRSEFRQMKQEIMETRKIYRRRLSLDSTSIVQSSSSSSSSLLTSSTSQLTPFLMENSHDVSHHDDEDDDKQHDEDDNHYCLRGVEQFIFPETKRVQVQRRDNLLYLLVDQKQRQYCGGTTTGSACCDQRSIGHGPVNDPWSSSSSSPPNSKTDLDENLVEALQATTREAVLEAIERALEDSKIS